MADEAKLSAEMVFESTNYAATDKEINMLAANMDLLAGVGLAALNRRMLQGGRGIWDTFTEHNFAAKVAKLHGGAILIHYEPRDGLRRPPDFKIDIAGTTYWVQIRTLSSLERESRQSRSIARIREAAKAIEIGAFFSVELAEDFADGDVPTLIAVIGQQARTAGEGGPHVFPAVETPKATFDIWLPRKTTLPHLTLGTAGDMNFVNETGLAKAQIVQSLRNAAGAFEWPLTRDVINLVAFDCTRHHDIDVADAIFGTEYDLIGERGQSWSRNRDGFLHAVDKSASVAAVIGLRRTHRSPVSDYYTFLYVNEAAREYAPRIHALLLCDKEIHYNMRPPYDA